MACWIPATTRARVSAETQRNCTDCRQLVHLAHVQTAQLLISCQPHVQYPDPWENQCTLQWWQLWITTTPPPKQIRQWWGTWNIFQTLSYRWSYWDSKDLCRQFPLRQNEMNSYILRSSIHVSECLMKSSKDPQMPAGTHLLLVLVSLSPQCLQRCEPLYQLTVWY